ncbi:MAG: hypothetical protein V6Z81_08600 [Parvularculales bacterium]
MTTKVSIDSQTIKTGMTGGLRLTARWLAPLVAMTLLSACWGGGSSVIRNASVTGLTGAPSTIMPDEDNMGGGDDDAGMGGGDTGDGTMTGDDNMMPPAPPLAEFAALSQHASLHAHSLTAARSVARAAIGSTPSGAGGGHDVTQSSTSSEASVVEIGIPATGTMGVRTYSLTNGSDVFLNSGAATNPDTVISVGRPYELSSLGAAGEVILLYGSSVEPESVPRDSGRMNADKTAIIAHDRQDNADTQYIAWGLWANTPVGTSDNAAMFKYGAFSYGAGAYTYPQARIAELTGEAKYNGHAVGVALIPGVTEGATGRTNAFVADVELTVDFLSSFFTGNARGEVNNFRYQNGGTNMVHKITLALRSLGGSDGGLFASSRGGITAQGADGMDIAGLTGEWGGKLYGAAHTSGEDHVLPAHVAGTFGVAHDTGMSLLGAFKADYRQPHPLDFFVPTAGSTSLAYVMARIGATGVDLEFGDSAEAGNFGRELATNCFYNVCPVPVDSSSNVPFSLANVSNLSLTGTGFTPASSMITQGFDAHGVTLARGRSSGTRLTNSVALETFGGWTDASAFGAVQIAQGETGSKIHRFTSYTAGVPSGSNPVAGVATWSGGAVASVKADRTFLHGDATVTLDLSDTANPTVDVMLDTWLGIDGTAMPSVAAVSYANMALAGGGFFSPAPEQIGGRFYGTNHTEVGGFFNTATLNGAFGGTRDTMGAMTPNLLAVFAPTAGSTSLAVVQSRASNWFYTHASLPGVENFGREVEPACVGRTCSVAVPGAGTLDFSYRTGISDLSLAGSDLTGATSMITNGVEAHGVTLARGRLTGTKSNIPVTVESFGGWTSNTFFNTVQIASGADGSEQYRFISFSMGGANYSNPAAGVGTWKGGAVASVKDDRTFLRGDATIMVDFGNTNVDVTLDAWKNIDGSASAVAAVSYTGMDLDRGYFEGAGTDQIAGVFYGTNHEVVGGRFNTAALNGSFGATRETR